jgi:hypothetical protein
MVPSLLTSALDGGEWSASHPCCFIPWEIAPGTHWIGGLVGPRAGPDVVEKRKMLPLSGFGPRRPDRSPSLHRLGYRVNFQRLVAYTLKMDTVYYLKNLVRTYWNIRSHDPKHNNTNLHSHENFKYDVG